MLKPLSFFLAVCVAPVCFSFVSVSSVIENGKLKLSVENNGNEVVEYSEQYFAYPWLNFMASKKNYDLLERLYPINDQQFSVVKIGAKQKKVYEYHLKNFFMGYQALAMDKCVIVSWNTKVIFESDSSTQFYSGASGSGC